MSLGKHLVEAVSIIFRIITINFTPTRFMPGDPVVHIIGEGEYLRLEVEVPEVIEEVRREYGSDKSLSVQCITYLNKMLHLDFGNSHRTKLSVLETASFCMRWALLLTIPAIVLSSVLGGGLGLWAGWKKGGLPDTITPPIILFLNTIPTNCMAILFLMVFAFQTRLFPISGITPGGLSGLEKAVDILRHMILSLMILVILRMASYYTLMKSTAQTIRDGEYITVAQGRGFFQGQVLRRHVLKNVLCPYLTSVCVQFGHILSGSMLMGMTFSWERMGTLIYDATNTKGFPILQTYFLLIGICVVTFNLLADVLNTLINPWLREEDRHA